MMWYKSIKRRVMSKGIPIIKRIVIPVACVFLLIQMFSFPTNRTVKEEIIAPGEALDPIIQESQAFEQAREYKFERISKEKHDHEIKKDYHTPKKIEKKEQLHSEDEQKPDSSIPSRLQTEWSMWKSDIPGKNQVKFKPHSINKDTVTLMVMSSDDKVFMSINKKEIYRAISKRGMHVVVLNQYSGRVMAKRVFDTFEGGTEEDMVSFLDDVTDGRIIVFAVLDEASEGMTWKGRNRLKELGAKWSETLGYRDMWGMVTRKGGLKIAETYSNAASNDTGYGWGGPLFFRTDFDLITEPNECIWRENDKNILRHKFCVRYEGYGDLCRCHTNNWNDAFLPVDPKMHASLSKNSLFESLGVVILANNRPHYLYRTLKSLYEAPGFNKKKTAVYVDSPTREMKALCSLFDVKIVQTESFPNTTNVVQKIRHKVQRALRDITKSIFSPKTIPPGNLPSIKPPFTAKNLLILEDDFVVAVDAFKYLQETRPILEMDKTALGISLFNYHGFRDTASSVITSYRSDDSQMLATMFTEATINKILVTQWPLVEDVDPWWVGIKSSIKENKGDIIHPEFPRAKHTAYEGYLVQGKAQDDLYQPHILNLDIDYQFPRDYISRLERTQYDLDLRKTIQNSKYLEIDFCTADLTFGKVNFVLYVAYDGKNDEDLMSVMACLKTWQLYAVGGWRSVWQFHYHGNLLTIVGYPHSPYSILKPESVKVTDRTSQSKPKKL